MGEKERKAWCLRTCGVPKISIICIPLRQRQDTVNLLEWQETMIWHAGGSLTKPSSWPYVDEAKRVFARFLLFFFQFISWQVTHLQSKGSCRVSVRHLRKQKCLCVHILAEDNEWALTKLALGCISFLMNDLTWAADMLKGPSRPSQNTLRQPARSPRPLKLTWNGRHFVKVSIV